MQTSTQQIGEAFQELRKGLFGYLRRRVSDVAVAEDLLQDVFLKAVAAGRSGQSPRHLTGWIYGIANNAIVDHYRSRRPTEPLPEDIAAAVEPEARIPDELSACLLPLTRTMPALYRDTLVATEFEGRTLKELSQRWNVSLSAVKSRASRGRRMLKDLLMQRCQVAVTQDGEVEYVPAALRRCGGKGCG